MTDGRREGVEAMRIEGLGQSGFGASVRGLDPSAMGTPDACAVRDAAHKALGLLVFEFGRLLEADELHALTALFGEGEFAPGLINGIGKRARAGEAEHSIEDQVTALRARGLDPFITHLGNVDPVSEQVREVDPRFFGEWEWHTDMSYLPVPPTFSLLHARQIPETGGDTGFSSQILAARNLPEALRERVENRRIKHDSTYGSSGVLRPGMHPPASPIEAIGHEHPILRRLPDGETALFLGRRTNAYIPGLPLDESEALLDELWAHATRAEFQYRHRWQIGQVVVWDNRMMLHMRHPVDDRAVRFMWRTQTRGEAVLPA